MWDNSLRSDIEGRRYNASLFCAEDCGITGWERSPERMIVMFGTYECFETSDIATPLAMILTQ